MNDAELRLALVLEASGEGLWEFVPAEGLVLQHPAFLALLGFPPGALGEPVDRFFQRVHEDERRQLINAVFEAVEPFEVRLRMRHADGGWRWHLARGRRIRNRVIVVQSDIGADLQREAAMADTLARYLALYNNAPLGFVVWNREGRITDWNQHAQALFGHSSPIALGRHFISLLFPPESQDELVAIARGLIQNGGSHQGEFINLAADGSLRRCRWNNVALRNSKGTISGVLSLVADQTATWLAEQQLLTHRDHLEVLVVERTAALEQARANAEAKAESKAAFLANMSHEIRTPMNAVIGLTRMTLRTALDHRQRDYLERISGAGKLLLSLINDVLDYSKIDADRLELEQAPFVLDEMLDSVATLVGGRAQEKGLEFHYVLDAGVPYRVIGDALRLTQVLVNLCSNALKFTASGHVVVRVGAEPLDSSRSRFSFSIEDTGIGLTAEQTERLFTAFGQANAAIARCYGGTGLGLMISRRLVQLMGGEIKLVSAPGHGTTFYVDIELGVEPGNAVRSSVPDDVAGQRVQIFDDHALAGEAIAGSLERLGMLAEVYRAVPGRDTLLPLADSVIIDYELPGTRDYIARLRATSATPGLPRIILLAGSDIEACTAAVEPWRADDCLTKPVTVVRLLRALIGERRSSVDNAPRYDGLRGHVVLVVDDEAVNRLIIGETLSDWGLTIDEAESAEQALAMVKRRDYSAILMDVQMPGMDGTDATRRLRAEGFQRPVIALTGHSLDAERTRCRDAGMNDIVTKPLDPDRLAHVLHQLLPPLAPDAVQAVLREAVERLTDTGQPAIASSTSEVTAPQLATIPDAVPAAGHFISPAPTFSNDNPCPAPFGHLPGINTTDGLRRLQGKTALYEKVLLSFLQRFAHSDDIIARALHEGRRDDAEREAHSLKGLAANIGADALSESAGNVEIAIRDHQPSEWPVAALTLELAQIIVSLRDRFQ